MKSTWKEIAAGLLMLLFVYAAVSKLLDFAGFRHQLYNQTFPHWLADVLLYALPAGELLLVLAIALPATNRTGLWLSLGLLFIFTVYIALARLHFWSRVPCSCGGVISHLSWTGHFFFNLLFIAINLVALYLTKKGKAENLRTE